MTPVQSQIKAGTLKQYSLVQNPNMFITRIILMTERPAWVRVFGCGSWHCGCSRDSSTPHKHFQKYFTPAVSLDCNLHVQVPIPYRGLVVHECNGTWWHSVALRITLPAPGGHTLTPARRGRKAKLQGSMESLRQLFWRHSEQG